MASPSSQGRSLPFKDIKDSLSLVLGNSSHLVKVLCISVFVGYLLSFSTAAVQALSIVPGNVLPPNFWVWTIATHGLMETHIWVLLLDVTIVVLCGTLLEPLWGPLEMVIFYAVTTCVVGILTTFTYLIVYLVTVDTDFLFEVRIFGLAGYAAGFSVAVKQVMSDSVLINSPFGKLRNKHVPIVMLLFAVIACLVGACEGPYPVMFAWGLLISWVYLRFYQKHKSGNRGDASENFSFASFFPASVQPFVAVFSNLIFGILVKMKICKKLQRTYNVGYTSPMALSINLPGIDPLDAERRRQLALKALNDRLSKTETTSWPSMDEGDPSGSPEASSAGPVVVAMPSDKNEPVSVKTETSVDI